MIKIGVLAILGVTLASIFKNLKSEYSFFISLGICLVIFSLLISRIQTLLSGFNVLKQYIEMDERYFEIILKMVGITYVSQLCGDICKDHGYQAIGNQVDMFSRITILFMSIPIVVSFFEMVGRFL